jgi:hypothetical protein
MRWLKILWPIAFWTHSACVSAPTPQSGLLDIQPESRGWQSTMQNLEDRISLIEAHLTYCSDEIRRLLGRVEQACTSSDVCREGETDILVEVLKSDPQKEGRFLTLMQDRKHVAYYLPAEGRELTAAERKQLRDLVKPAWFDEGTRHTRFLVVSHPEDNRPEAYNRAERRGQKIIDAITEISRQMGVREPLRGEAHGGGQRPQPGAAGTKEDAHTLQVAAQVGGQSLAPADAARESAEPQPASGEAAAAQGKPRHRVLHWIFPFFIKGESLRPEDRPRSANDKLNRSVWVYRVDC